MELTKQRKMLIGILGTGILGLVVDRFVLAPPEMASADFIGAEDLTADEKSVDRLLSEKPEERIDRQALPSFESLTERLIAVQSRQVRQTSQSEIGHDPFAVPEDWQPASAPEPVSEGEFELEDMDSGQNQDQQFLAQHRLDSTFRTAKQFRAVVDRKTLSLGDTLAGYRLVQINSRWVLWQSIDGDRPVVMHLSADLEKTKKASVQAP